MQKTITKTLILAVVLVTALGVNYIFAAWVGPTQDPTDGNTSTPIHIGTTDQVKDGGLSLDGLSVFGGGYFQGGVGIDEVTLSTGGEQDLKLDVEGAIGAQYYCDESGNNCVDGNVLGSGVDSDWTISGNDMYSGVSGNVGIGTVDPTEELDVTGNIKASGTICDSGGCIKNIQSGVLNHPGANPTVHNFPQPFNSIPNVVVTSHIGSSFCTVRDVTKTTFSTECNWDWGGSSLT
jgi:hypothetical protein